MSTTAARSAARAQRRPADCRLIAGALRDARPSACSSASRTRLIAFIARFSIAAVFWNSGQTKVEGFVLNLVCGEFALGWPRLSDSALALFQDEYKLPLIPPELAAPMAATAEHVFPLLILVGLGTRFRRWRCWA